MTRFSIVTPVYNVENEIRKCLDTIKNQTFNDFEVLCVDDCGTDNSVKIAEEYANEDARFKILKHEHNKGVSAARNTAIEAATGEYLVFIDSDDWIELNALEIIDKAITNSGKDFILFGYNNCNENGDVEKHEYDNNEPLIITPENIRDAGGCVWNKTFKTSKIKEFGIEFPVGLVIEDAEFCFKALSQIKYGYIAKDAIYNYRVQRQGSITTEDITNERLEDTFIITERIFDFIIEKNMFKEYRNYMLKSIIWLTKCIIGTPNKREYIIRYTDKLLQKIDFPNAFKDLETPKFMFWKN
ncbi:glycosyltransferase family 2 protein [bacterium]|nr:glycosyltransferase family 2 protein [bacterium]